MDLTNENDVNQQPERNNLNINSFSSGNSTRFDNESSSPHNQHSNIEEDTDICRVCRCEATPDRPLFYPCICTGSIKYIHQDCLVQWLKYSKKEYCELCKHKFSFAPIYHPDMPKRLPARDILTGLIKNIFKAIKFWLHSTLVAISWLAIVPLTACRIYRCLFSGSVSTLLTLPLDILSTENIIADIFQGAFVVLCSLAAFISLVWLREQILSGGGPDWLENEELRAQENVNIQNNINRMNRIRNMRRQHQLLNNQNINNNNNNLNVNNNAEEGNLNNEQLNANNIEQLANNLEENYRIENNNAENPNVNEEQPMPRAQNVQQQVNDDNHWNPIEWDRAAEDLTWDRLLGLDGSLLFLEHVFWVISLNTLFILVFAFCPYHLGHYLIFGLKMEKAINKTHFEGLITILIGYVLLAILLVFSFAFMTFTSFHRARKVIGLCYIVIKVALLVVFEICVFPFICGVWIDLCSLKLFNATITERKNSFDQSPGTSVFIHWLAGMIYVFYFATFVFLLREVLRPGILWFLRNLNDPEFNPVQEMIMLPVFRHIRRFVTSVTLFGFSIFLLLLLPINIINFVSEKFNYFILPYNVATSSETLSTELSFELLWLHAALPAFLEQTHIRNWTKNLLKLWAIVVSWLLGLKSFLLGEPDKAPNSQDEAPQQQQQQQQQADNNNAQNNLIQAQQNQELGQNPFQFNIGMAHQALLQNNQPTVNMPYTKPSHFKIRIAALMVIICFSLFASSIIVLTVPVSLGRWILFKLTEHTKLNELYTAVTGFYAIWLSIRLTTIIYNFIQIGVYQLYLRVKEKIAIFFKMFIATFMIFGFLPLLFGMLFQHIVINPISCNHDQTPIISLWQIWALGVLHTKIATALILTGPQWWLKQVVERICQDGVRNIDLKFMFTKLIYPVTMTLGLVLAIPCILSRSIAPLFFSNEHYLNLIERRIYPFMLFLTSFLVLFIFQIKQFKRLYERIRNDKYLVGQRLINFERSLANRDTTPANLST